MAKYGITYRCGHSETIEEFGKETERTRKREWLQTQLCLACQNAFEEERARQRAQEEGLPELVGTEKQVAWALRIRLAALDEMRRYVRGKEVEGAVAQEKGHASAEDVKTTLLLLAAVERHLRVQSKAAWWIEHRNEDLVQRTLPRILAKVPLETWQQRARAALAQQDAGGC